MVARRRSRKKTVYRLKGKKGKSKITITRKGLLISPVGEKEYLTSEKRGKEKGKNLLLL